MTQVTLSTFHNTFPRIIYPTETHTEIYNGRQYSITEPFNTGKTSDTFNLGVYSLSQIDKSLIPIDPLCLLTMISILKKENAKFPLKSDEIITPIKPCSKSSVSILSYHAAIDDQLPILIEDSKDKIDKLIVRKIHNSKFIISLNSLKLSDTDTLIFNSINEKLFDFFIHSILNLDDEILLNYYSLYNYNFTPFLKSLSPISKIMASNVRNHLLKRNEFHLRNPEIFLYHSSSINPKSTKLAYIAESKKISENVITLLSDLNDIFQAQNYWNNGTNEPSILDFQIASYIYCIIHMSSYIPEFEKTISQYSNLVNHANRIISSFI
jgi:hypothetical protein